MRKIFFLLTILPAILAANQLLCDSTPPNITTTTVENMINMTLDELSRYDGVNNSNSFVSVNRIIFDVTSNRCLHGNRSLYDSKSPIAGRDITRMAIRLNQTANKPVWDDCNNLDPFKIEQLTKFFTKKYATVGYLVRSHSDSAPRKPSIDECVSGGNLTVNELLRYDGSQSNCIFIAVNRLIFNVTDRSDLYGLNGIFNSDVPPAGRDLTRILIAQYGQPLPIAKMVEDYSEFPAEKLKNLVDYYKSQYPVVGYLIPSAADDNRDMTRYANTVN